MRHFIIAIFLLLSPCLHAQNQPTFEQALYDAQNGDSSAYGWVGFFYYEGKSVARNYSEAIKWLKKAAENGDSRCYAYLGSSYFELQNYQEAVIWLKKAVNNGDTRVYVGLGASYKQLKQYSEAISWLKKATDYDDNQAYFLLSQCYYAQFDYEKAIIWAKKAANNGETRAYIALGASYMQLKQYSEAMPWLKKAVDNNDIQAFYWLGIYYIIQKNDQEAFKWIKKAAEKGDVNSYLELGSCYDFGIGVEKNIYEAINWYKKANEKGNELAASSLCSAYYKLGNYTETKKWAEIAITQKEGNFVGHRILALLNMYGLGTQQNKDKAFEFIAKAIDEAKQKGGPMPNTLDAEGELYLANNDISKAREIYNTILKETPDFYAQTETKLSKFMKEHKGDDVDINIPIANNMSNLTFAVILSNEKYQMEKPVQYAENAGKIFTEYCKKALGLPEKNVHFITNATLNNIKHEIKWLQDVIAVYNGDAKVIFYYAGHGIPDEQNKSAYLLPIDGYGSDVTTGYALEDLYKALGCLPSKAVTVFLDACFSGAKRDGDMLASARGVAIKVKQNYPTGNMVVFTAAQGDETAYPYKEEGHGLFTYYLLKKLQETKGDVTLGELGDYIKTQVERQSIVTNGKLQSPAILSASSIGNSWKEWKLNK